MEFLPTGGVYYPPEALGGVKKAGLKKEKGFLGIAQGAAKKAVTKSIEDALGPSKRPKEAQPSEAFAQMPAEALASSDTSEAPSDYQGAPEGAPGAPAPGAPAPGAPAPAGGGSTTGLIAIAAAAIGAYFIMKG
jgi:hypothetical protein